MNRILSTKHLNINKLSFLTKYRPIIPFYNTTSRKKWKTPLKQCYFTTYNKAYIQPIYSNLPLLLLIKYAQNNKGSQNKGNKVPNFFGFFLLLFLIIVLGLSLNY